VDEAVFVEAEGVVWIARVGIQSLKSAAACWVRSKGSGLFDSDCNSAAEVLNHGDNVQEQEFRAEESVVSTTSQP